MRANALGRIAAAINRGSVDRTGALWKPNLAASLKINPRRSGVVMTVVVGGFGAN
jgi:hypothetical protein